MNPDQQAGTSRIAVNTTLLYARMIIVMIINLYTVRLVLNALGVVNYGIYDVVAGLIYTMASASNVLATATQRYYAYALGEKNLQRFQDIFSVSVVLYAVLSIAVLVLGESVGLWFVNTMLVVPQEKILVANYVYQMSILAFVLSIIHLPFSSAIITHENLGLYAAISVAESVMKMIAAKLITKSPFDYLLYHGMALLVVSVVVATCFVYFATSRYPECRFRYPADRRMFRQVLAFSGWSFFGSVAGVGIVQVITIMVNIFFGPAISASRAISLQLSNAVNIFTGSLITAVRPAMVKSYTERSFDYLNQIFSLSNKFIFFGLMIICVPLFLEMDSILSLWLKTADANTVRFSRLIVIYSMVMALNNPISVIMQATGHVKEYHLLVEPFMLLCVPATYVLFVLGYPAYSTYVVMIVAAILAHLARLWCLRRYYRGFRLPEYVYGFALPSLAVISIVGMVMYAVHVSIHGLLQRLIAQLVLSVVLTVPLAYTLGTTLSERVLLKQISFGRLSR